MATQSREIGIQAKNKPGHWVQTERKAHEAWAGLVRETHGGNAAASPRGADGPPERRGGQPEDTFQAHRTFFADGQYAVKDLVAERWISVVKLNGPGTVSAYVVNDRVAWGQPRDQLRLSVFSAAVVVDHDDQDESLLGHGDLRRIPTLYPGEQQLPTGPGEPPSQPGIPGMEPDLPALTETEEWERRGQQRLPMPDEPCFLDDGEPLEPPTRVTLPRR